MHRGERRRPVHLLIIALLLAAVTVPVLIGTQVSSVEARKYKHHHYKKHHYHYGPRIARCKHKCAQTNAAISRCIGQNHKQNLSNCKQIYKQDKADCTGSDAKSCKTRAKGAYKSCAHDAAHQQTYDKGKLHGNYGLRGCGKCCQRTKGSNPSSCLGYFGSSRFYGSSKGNCVISTTSTSSSTVPSSTLPGSPSGAFTADITTGIRERLARLVPWLTEGWSD